ncbi:hypothetical protein J32TS6_39070 [Virgibacillus pantothenticus]|uniref:DUF402 domain-containing protein n=1 Tax=Virgibacillus pantothenticus TaxID=1473 RepID=A0A0L0QR42_VIRPA|nr:MULTISPECIES: DUF402 domain-containing protein [Virgibacillus]API90734.1 hypothetical protein BKP57_01960 [Virgibacillus sp. 6R]KNE20683.1 hypothetical protein AFK71_20285 [Virgibacillus pantothenticus]MBS7427665.1 DUF402 domain-containing protein [Virgibacillus sp. 19R1-5]MBU8566152.1 DUF402 domain-containing protein [Virgibacillus pantothenticus]MBU8600552.1 DUF402 domain-containing protein [Virgibacillus pantothenticus]
MDNWNNTNIQLFDKVIERKIRYDKTIVEHTCTLLEAKNSSIVLFHKIATLFTMVTDQDKLTIPKGSYTLAYYWKYRPFNLYIWRNENGNYLGSYFNIVKNTCLVDNLLSFEDLIIDVLVFPNGDCFILDEDELPKPLAQFEHGFALQSLNSLIGNIDSFLGQTISNANMTFPHKKILPLLNS